MTNRRGWGNFLAMLLLFVGTRFRDSSPGDGLRYAAFSYITADIVL